jgi:hypothetical protein
LFTPSRRLSDLTIVLPSSPTFHSSPPYRVLGGGLKRSSEETFLESSCTSTSRPGGICALLKRQRWSSCPFLGADHHVMAAAWMAASKSTTSVDAFGVDFTAASAPLCYVFDFDCESDDGWEMNALTRPFVSQRPPISLFEIVARTHMYTDRESLGFVISSSR